MTRVALAAAAGDGVDLLMDCICSTAAQAKLLPLARHAGSTVMISSKAVYVDDAGPHSTSDAGARFAGPISEAQPTMAPMEIDHRTRAGYGANKVAAEQVPLDSGALLTVLRPSKIHGQGARRPREWYFLKRALGRGQRCCWPAAASGWITPRRRRTSPRSFRSLPNDPGSESSTLPTRTHPTDWPSPRQSRAWPGVARRSFCTRRRRCW
jgi:hypothetical protein